jgi:antitoxin (DNA-binding transcriptional repressor) of toxin-antitoxin stability system
MRDTVITIEDAAARLPEVVERVRSHREPTVILRAERPVVRVVPVPSAGEVAEDLVAFLRRWRNEYRDHDDQLAEAIEESRHAAQPLRNSRD